MKAFLLAALLAAASLAARAQTYYLDLTGQTLSVLHRTVALEQVVDGRVGNPPIGIVYRGLNGKSAAVAFRQGPAEELTQFARPQLLPASTDHVVVLCLRSLHIGETMGGTKQQATADLTADAYEHLPTGYHFVQTVSAHASTSGHEITGRHPAQLAQVLSQCFTQLNQANWTAVARQPARTLAELPTNVPAPLALSGRRGPAILREAPRRGLYYRLDQFLANQPDTTSAFEVESIRRGYQSRLAEVRWLGVAHVRPLAPAGAPAIAWKELWGFSDGHQVFVRYDKQFFPLMRQGGFFTFVGEAPLDQLHAAAQAQRQSSAGMMGGAVGGALAAATSGGIPDHTAEPLAYGLDLRTGAIGPYPGPATPVRPDTAYVYVYRMPQSPPTGGPAVAVLAENREVGTLRPGQYLEVPWARFGKPLRLCLGGLPLASPCLLVVPNTSQLNYLKINPPGSAVSWQWVPPAQGVADLDELDKQAKAAH